MVIVYACRKTDSVKPEAPVKTKNTLEQKFFESHTTSNALINGIKQFVKGENNKYNYLEKLTAQIGFPYWDKATIVSKSHIGVGNRGNSEDSVNITYIPFVRDSQNYVNASLLIKTSPSDTAFQFLLDWQYTSYGFDTTSQDWNARDVFHLFASFDREVFGRVAFKITDERLFGEPDSGEFVIVKIRPQQNTQQKQSLLISITMCDYIDVCYNPPGGNPCGNFDCSEDCPQYEYTYTECTTFWVEDGWTPAGGGSGVGSGGSGGGGNGGGWTPPPCGGVTARGNVTEPCSGGGGGWVPIEPEPTGNPTPKPPCDKVAPLKTDPEYINNSIELKNSTNLNYEKAYIQKKDRFFDYKEGPVNEGRVDLIIRDTVLNINHSHYEGKMFSEDDLGAAWLLQTNQHLVDTAFTLGVCTNAGTSYVFTIDDPALFQAFGNKYFGVEGGIKDLEDIFNKGYKIGKSNSSTINETSFLEFINNENVGISLLKANDTFTGYQRLFLNSSGILTSVPCN